MENHRLRQRRESTVSPSGTGLPMTRAELAAAVNTHVWATMGEECHLDVDTLARYERGKIRWPGPVYRAGLRAVLGAETDEELGFLRTRRGITSRPVAREPAFWGRGMAPVETETVTVGSEDALDALGRALMWYERDGREISDVLKTINAAAQHVGRAFDEYQSGRIEPAARFATGALDVLGSSRTLHPDMTWWRALVHQIAAIVLAKAGRREIALLAADRGVADAERAGDPCLHLSLVRTTAFTMAAAGHAKDAIRTVDGAAQDFQGRMSATPMAASVYGTILLTGAMLAAECGDRSGVAAYLDEAEAASAVLDGDRNELWTAFGPANVAIHRANTAAAVGDMDAVLDIGRKLDVDHLPVERQVRLRLDIARAGLAVGDREDALATLVRAEATAPAQVHHHQIAKDVVTALLDTAPRRPGIELDRLAARVGVAE